MSEDESHRSVSKEIDAELPDTFTNNIISMIQNKQQETPAEEYVEEVSEPDQEIYHPPPKNNCKKSGKKTENGIISKSRKPKELKNKVKSKELDSEYIEDTESIEESQNNPLKRGPGRPKAEKNSQNKHSKDFQALKGYFQEFLSNLLTKIQEATNKKLNQLVQRIEELEQKSETHVQPKRKVRTVDEQQYTVKKQKTKRHRYIKTWMKLEYVDKIERGLMNVKEASRQLKIKESMIESWISNKQKLMAMDSQRKGKKTYKDELDSDMLEIE